MIPEPVLYAAYVVLVAFGVAVTVAIVAGTYLIWQGVKAFKDIREDGMKGFMPK